MRKTTATGAAVLTLAVIAYTGFHAWLAFGLPAPPLSDVVKTCADKRVIKDRVLYTYDYYRCVEDWREAQVLRTHPALATKDAGGMTIFYSSHPVARLTPRPSSRADMDRDPTNATCDDYRLVKAISVRDPVSARMEPLAVVTCHRDTLSFRALIGPDGKSTLVTEVSASPDGSVIVYGDNAIFRTSEQPGLVLEDWKTRKTLAAFAPRCHVIAWHNATHFDVTCMYDPDWRVTGDVGLPFRGRVWKDGSGQWRLQATRWLDLGRPGVDEAEGRTDYAPGFSLRWLPSFGSIARDE